MQRAHRTKRSLGSYLLGFGAVVSSSPSRLFAPIVHNHAADAATGAVMSERTGTPPPPPR